MRQGKTINEIALGCTERVNVHLFRLHNMITLLIEKPPAIHIRFSWLQIVYRHQGTHISCAHTILMGFFLLFPIRYLLYSRSHYTLTTK